MKTASRRLFLAALPALALGCKGGHKFSQEELDRARQTLEASLDSWKKGEMPEKLRSRSEPIQFAEEWPRQGVKLLDYQVLGSEHTDSATMRFTVKLTVQDRRGKREERQVTYAVALKPPLSVGRDPFF